MLRNRVVVESVLAGLSQSEAARRYGLSQAPVSQLMARYRSGGMGAVTPASRQPIAKPISMTMDTVASARWNKSSFAFSFALSP